MCICIEKGPEVGPEPHQEEGKDEGKRNGNVAKAWIHCNGGHHNVDLKSVE